MFLLIEIVISLFALGLLVPISVLFVECVAGLLPRHQIPITPIIPRPRVDVLVPAHNEADEITATLLRLLPQLTQHDRLVVIADNCDDHTADIARALGATVIERKEPNLRGKGYALDYGLKFIATNPPAVVVVVDADCIAEHNLIEQIAQLAIASGRPVQAPYLMHQLNNPGLNDLLAMLALTVRNFVRPRGLERLGLPCLLTGSGMAFPWAVICQASLANSHTVDDLQLALDLAIAGYAPLYCQSTQILGRLMKQDASLSQKIRWEHGHLELLYTKLPRLLKEAVQQARVDLLVLALDLCVPPLSLLCILWCAGLGGAILAGEIGQSWIAAKILAGEGLLVASSVVAVWVKFSQDKLSFLTLLGFPLYILWKLPIYTAFLVRPQTKWLRTERDLAKAPD